MLLATIIICKAALNPCTTAQAYIAVPVQGEFVSHSACERAAVMAVPFVLMASPGGSFRIVCGEKYINLGNEV